MSSQPPTVTSDAPFGLEPNVAAGIAYLVGWVSGLVMLLGGGTNKVVKWAAAQSIVLWLAVWLAYWVVGIVLGAIAFAAGAFVLVLVPVLWLMRVACLVLWLWTTISAFQGKDLRIPVVADWTQRLFASMLA